MKIFKKILFKKIVTKIWIKIIIKTWIDRRSNHPQFELEQKLRKE